MDYGHKYRTGIYSEDPAHLDTAKKFIQAQPDSDRIKVEVLPLTNYVRSAEEHQNRLALHPEDFKLCSIPLDIINKYK